jgi:hypothetical protein
MIFITSAALDETGLTDVIDDFGSSLSNSADARLYEIMLIKVEGRGPILQVSHFFGRDRSFRSYFHLPPTHSPTASQARAQLVALIHLTDWASFRTPVNRADFIWDEGTRSWQEWHSASDSHGDTYEFVDQIWIGAAALWFLGELADTYASRLADHPAETTFKARRSISLRRRRRDKRDCVRIEVPEETTTIVLPSDLSDDAREAFIDLDPTADGIRGKTLYWDQKQRAWVSNN